MDLPNPDATVSLEHLILRETLHRFFCDYFDAVESLRLERLPDLFIPEGEFAVYFSEEDYATGKAGIRARGISAIRDTIRSSTEQIEHTHHTMGNFRIDMVDGRPVARAHLRAYHRAKGAALGKDEESLSRFKVSMAWDEGRWKIARFDYIIRIILGSLEAFPDPAV